jgi:hypothetical protein
MNNNNKENKRQNSFCGGVVGTSGRREDTRKGIAE